MIRPLLVVGTDTGVGKTIVSAALVGQLRAHYWKPVQSGLEEETDSELVRRLCGLEFDPVLPEAYRLQTPCSPHEAARIDGVEIDPDRLVPPRVAGPLVIEGAGGVLTPLRLDLVYADVFARWNARAVVVARTSLGTINHCLLTLEAVRTRGVEIAGVVFSGEAEPVAEAAIEAIGRVRRLGRLSPVDPLTAATLQAAAAEALDLDALR
ncbi:MAG: dethiobiotin synthase [Pseudomonadota bacterium]|jgi:dethiobiotin synthetase